MEQKPSLGKFANSLPVKKKSMERKEVNGVIRKRRNDGLPDVPPTRRFVRFHWCAEDGRHYFVIFSKIDQKVIYRYCGYRFMAEIKYTNRLYGKSKIIHKEKEFID